MLYERWRQKVEDRRDDVALWDSASGRRWTFGQLASTVDRAATLPEGPVFAKGLSLEFVMTVLTAWRDGRVLCPLEEGQSPSPVEAPPAGCVHLKTTSASTGAPRLIAFTAEQLIADADQIVDTMGLRREWPNLGVISLAHSYGFSNLVLPLLLHGIPLILGSSPLPESVRKAAALVEGIALPAVPALWRAWKDANAIPNNVRIAISAGAPLPAALEQEIFDGCHLKIHNFYGASECGGIAYDSNERPRTDATAVGFAMRGVELRICDQGCLQVRSKAVGLTYWPKAEPVLGNGVFQTSDLAEINDGLVFLRGRQTDQINVAGRKVSPETIERALLRNPAVSECLVFGAPSPDSDRAEMIVACVALRSDTSAQNLRQHLLACLPAWQVPRDWWFVPNLETNARGKLPRGEWRRRYLEKQSAALPSDTNQRTD